MVRLLAQQVDVMIILSWLSDLLARWAYSAAPTEFRWPSGSFLRPWPSRFAPDVLAAGL